MLMFMFLSTRVCEVDGGAVRIGRSWRNVIWYCRTVCAFGALSEKLRSDFGKTLAPDGVGVAALHFAKGVVDLVFLEDFGKVA